MSSPTHYRYDKPPVVEVILGAQFVPVPGMSNGHLGAYWTHLGEEWNRLDDQPALEPQFENFSEEGVWRELGVRLRLQREPRARLQIRNRSGDRMIQVQNGRFLFNWIRLSSEEYYPSYEQLLPAFKQELGNFSSFAEGTFQTRLQFNQWEVTYINHIPRGTVWNTPSDWGVFLPLPPPPRPEGFLEFESATGKWLFVISENRGRLHVSLSHGKGTEGVELLVLNLTARGPLPTEARESGGIDGSLEQLLAGIDLGHNAIVSTFPRLFAAYANEFWGIHHE